MLEAKDRNARGQGRETRTQRASVFQKKVFLKFTARSLAHSPRPKKGHDRVPFSTNQKIVLSSTENRAFLRTCRLGGQGQGLYYGG